MEIAMKTINLTRLAVGAALLLLAGLSQAQYMWIDEKGLKQFSDRPPPPSTPQNKILKSPASNRLVVDFEPVPPPASTVVATPMPASAPKATNSLAEREADYKKRVTEKAEANAKTEQEEKNKAALAENCAAARRAKNTLDSGARIGVVDSNGQQGVMDEQARAKENQRVSKMLADCKSG
jgi:type IV secretory pathway VirB10-like protein